MITFSLDTYEGDFVIDPSGNPQTIFLAMETRRIVSDAMSQLEKQDEHMLHLRYFEGCTFAEIAGQMNIARSTAKRRLDKATKLLIREIGHVLH